MQPPIPVDEEPLGVAEKCVWSSLGGASPQNSAQDGIHDPTQSELVTLYDCDGEEHGFAERHYSQEGDGTGLLDLCDTETTLPDDMKGGGSELSKNIASEECHGIILDYELITSTQEEENSGINSSELVIEEAPYIVEMTSPEGRKFKIFASCVKGICSCEFELMGIKSQLEPCRFASMMWGNASLSERYIKLLWWITDGFPIVDHDVEGYECENYNSITTSDVKPKMDSIIEGELQEGAISLVNTKPTCIHALGAVPKLDGGIRHITDCSRPFGISVNNHCESLIEEFCFKNISNVTDMVQENYFMTVVDIKAAYRAVPIYPPHRKYQGFSWEWKGKKSWFQDNRMCFG